VIEYAGESPGNEAASDNNYRNRYRSPSYTRRRPCSTRVFQLLPAIATSTLSVGWRRTKPRTRDPGLRIFKSWREYASGLTRPRHIPQPIQQYYHLPRIPPAAGQKVAPQLLSLADESPGA